MKFEKQEREKRKEREPIRSRGTRIGNRINFEKISKNLDCFFFLVCLWPPFFWIPAFSYFKKLKKKKKKRERRRSKPSSSTAIIFNLNEKKNEKNEKKTRKFFFEQSKRRIRKKKQRQKSHHTKKPKSIFFLQFGRQVEGGRFSNFSRTPKTSH